MRTEHRTKQETHKHKHPHTHTHTHTHAIGETLRDTGAESVGYRDQDKITHEQNKRKQENTTEKH